MNKKDLMTLIQQYAFAFTETTLFLDSHPHCTEALEYMDKLSDKLSELTCQYEEKYGPITAYSAGGSCWNWTSTPWPWEICD